MLNCMNADVLRIQKKKSYLIMISIVVLSIMVSGIVALVSGDNGSRYFEMITSLSLAFCTLLIGIPIYNAVLTDDFKSRTMQIAIGRGLSRHKLICTRLLEIIIIVFEACIVLTLFTLVCGLIGGVKLSSILPGIQLIGRQFVLTVAYSAVSMIFAYLSQNGTSGLILYILMSSGALNMILNGILGVLPVIKDYNIGSYLISGMVNKISESASFGTGLLWFLVLVVVWVCLPTFITMKIFEKKELEF